MEKIKQHKEKILGLLISIIFVVLIFWNLDFHKLLETFKIFNYKVLALFIPLYIAGLYIRGVRWKYLLCNKSNLTATEGFFAFTTGNTINSYLPARAGDFWRAYHIGEKLKESKMKMLGSIILERIIDGISVLMILLFAVLTYFRQSWVLKITYVSAILFIGSLVFFFIILKFNKTTEIFKRLSQISVFKQLKPALEKTANLINKFIDGFQALNSPKCLLMGFFTSCTAWAIECVITYILVLGFGQHYGFSVALFVISFIALSTIIPSSSVFVGPYQYAYILALGIYQVPKANALAIAFIHQIAIMLIITVISIVYFNLAKTNLGEIQKEIEQNND